MLFLRPSVFACLTVLLVAPARAQDAPSLPGDDESYEVAEEAEAPPTPEEVQEELLQLKDRMSQLEQQLLSSQRMALERQSPIVLSGYVDFGAFFPTGDGAGIIQDFGNRNFPEYANRFGWVFLGDILGTAVNSRGEAADLGPSPGIERFDSVDSGGAPGFILNEFNLALRVGLGESAQLRTSVNFVPRSGREFALGDFIDVDLAELEWTLSESTPTSVFVGKIEPVFGIEYKYRRARTRFGITPSLVGRYNIGTQLGAKIRSKLFDQWLILAAAITNGSAVQEQFHFYDEIDRNYGKTLTGRIALSIPLDRLSNNVLSSPFEIGFSGQWGAQDLARDNEGNLLLFGPDLEYRGVDLRLHGQLILGEAPGQAVDGAFSLDLKLGGYLEVDYLITSIFGVMARFDIRSADVALGDDRLYLTRSWRLTVGARADLSRHLAIKAEFLKNFEYGGIPEFRNDILTSSLLVMY